ncbi:hypothetical protein F2Q69_00053243 [Brassica cretica]|uniref:Uncharacterized protein n=1 Tax=Brassica cretica TaxID=69181 RepID=A0A8S9N5X3_BRACR|nr:hypothetical protein F2Q69_00053243 [Brassica cretica]
MRDFTGTWFNKGKEEMDTCFPTSPSSQHYLPNYLQSHKNKNKQKEDLSRRLPSVSTDANQSTSIDIVLPTSTDINILKSVDIHSGLRNSGGIVRDLEVQIGNALVPVDFHVLDIKLNWNSSLLLGRAFLSTVGAVCNLQTNQLCLTLIDPNTHYDPIPVKKPQTTSRRINDPRIIAACQYGDEYETDYSESIETHSASSIDTGHRSTDTAYYKSIDTIVHRAQEGDYSVGSWADEHHHESFAVETATYAPGADELREGFTHEELLNMQRHDEPDQIRVEAHAK